MRPVGTPWFLIAEDDADDYRILESFLNTTYPGVKVVWRHNGEELLHLLTQGAAEGLEMLDPFPKAILLDMDMPRANGLETLLAIRRRLGGWRYLPVIILSGRRDDALLAQAYRSGASACLNKNDCFSGALPSPLERCLASLIWREVPVIRLDWRPAPALQGVLLGGRR